MTDADVKAVVRERDGHRCTQCKMTAEEHRRRYHKTLDVHRLTPGSPYTVEGCITICRSCHGPQPRRVRGSRLKEDGVIQVVLRGDLNTAFTKYLASLHPAPQSSAVLVVALRDFLKAEGFYPPPP